MATTTTYYPCPACGCGGCDCEVELPAGADVCCLDGLALEALFEVVTNPAADTLFDGLDGVTFPLDDPPPPGAVWYGEYFVRTNHYVKFGLACDGAGGLALAPATEVSASYDTDPPYVTHKFFGTASGPIPAPDTTVTIESCSPFVAVIDLVYPDGYGPQPGEYHLRFTVSEV